MTAEFRPVEQTDLAKLLNRSLTTEQFLTMFGVRVRNHDNVARIRAALDAAGMDTVPSFATCAGTADLHLIKATPTPVDAEPTEDDLPSAALPHRALQVGDLPSARAGLVSVTSSAVLATATIEMRAKNYSQLPVIDGTSDLRGILTWSSIARVLETGQQPTLMNAMVKDSMPVAEVHQQLLAHLPAIAQDGYLLVRANN